MGPRRWHYATRRRYPDETAAWRFGGTPDCSRVATQSDRAEVLLADDDADVRDAVSEVLEEEGYRVIGVPDGRQVLDRLRAGHIPAVILLDLAMPVMDGRALCFELMNDPELSCIPVIVLTATRDPQTWPTHATDILTKPFSLEALLERVKGFVRPDG